MELVVVWFVLSFVVGIAAARANRSSGGWALLALIISPLLAGLALALVGASPAPTSVDASGPDTHVRCPDCRELVRKDARKCKHCGSSLTPQ
jgi:hypothetical protein